MSWCTCVVVTCPSLTWATSIEAELGILQKRGIIAEAVKILTVEDPASNIGSGAATLNALLVVTEFLSVQEGYSVISSDVLASSRILILHVGREFAYEPCGKAFMHLPSASLQQPSAGPKLETNLLRLFHLIGKLQCGGPPGIWVCSTDMILNASHVETIDWCAIQDGALICCPSTPEYATSHGAVEVDKDGQVANILYSAPLETLQSYVRSNRSVLIVSGIVFLSTHIAESLLSLNAKSPVDSCTYMGLDSGAEPMQISLFFDLLMAMATNVSRDAFVSGMYGHSYDRRFSLSRKKSVMQARGLVWEELSRYRLKAVALENVSHHYLSHSTSGSTYLSYLWSCNNKTCLAHAAFETENITASAFLGINCLLTSVKECKIRNGTVLRDCNISASSIEIGKNCFLNGITFFSPEEDFVIPDETCIMKFEISLPTTKCKASVFVVFGARDNLSTSCRDPEFTIFNKSVEDFFRLTSWDAANLWLSQEGDTGDSLMTAKLFAVGGDIRGITSVLEGRSCAAPLKQWKEAERLSLQDILSCQLVKEQLAERWQTYFAVAASVTKRTLTMQRDLALLPFFVDAHAVGYEDTLMSVLDTVAESDDTKQLAVACRTFSCIADFLGAMAGISGGLRSGPGGNKAWLGAFELLERGYIAEGAVALRSERQKWTDRPDRMMRAARHYEGALQVLVREAVLTAKKFARTSSDESMCPCDTWVVAECPARIDVFGGWTDTPPICYEMGGSVINLAVLVDSEKPVRAKARRLQNRPHVVLTLLHGDITEEMVIQEFESLLDYNQPGAHGALLKACLIGSDVLQMSAGTGTLAEQLQARYEGGIELETWSSLPQGSGLGTSSILASAIVATLWKVTGQQFTRQSLIHCVLNVEQLLTTGGGWQDQVGGVMGGLCRGFSEPELPLKVHVERLPLPENYAQTLSRHFLLLYTGKVRLAKNLLQTVIRNWYARDSKVVVCFRDLLSKCQTEAKEAFLKRDLCQIGTAMNEYWSLKKVLASGCEPLFVQQIMDLLKPHVYGQLLLGAGGGGFLCALTREPDRQVFFQDLLSSTKGMQRVTVHTVTVDQDGLSMTVAGQPVCVTDV